MIQKTYGRSHTAVLEACRRVEAIVLHGKRGPDPCTQFGIGLDYGGLPFSQIDDILHGHNGEDQFMKPEYTGELGQRGVPSRIKDLFPRLGRYLPEAVEPGVLYLQERAAFRAGIDKIIDIV